MITLLFGAAALAAGWWLWDGGYGRAEAYQGGALVMAASPCDLPRPSDDATMVFAGFYEGAAVSTVRLVADNAQEEGTSAVEVAISPGFQPIYLVVTGSRASVLNFTGWTSRLDRVVVLTSDDYPTGVTGLPSERVTFASRRDCGIDAETFYGKRELADPRRAASLVRRPYPAGTRITSDMPPFRPPEAVGGAYQPERLTISARGVGATELDHDYAESFSDPIDRMEREYDPAGVVQVPLNQIIANVPARPYETLPGWAGLAQLVREGKLEKTGSDTFRVLAPIQVPAGLYGATSVRFELTGGVPAPTGDLGHSRIR